MLGTLLVVAGAVSLHWALCAITASAWWVPDLTLLATVLVCAVSPRRWWWAAGLAGAMTMCWAVRFPAAVLVWYLLLGCVVSFLSRVWDLEALGVQLVVVGMAEAAWLVLHLWLQDAAVVPLLGWAVGHVLLTAALVPLGRRLVRALGVRVS